MPTQTLSCENSHWLAPISPDLLIEIAPNQEPVILDTTPRFVAWSGFPPHALKQQTLTKITIPFFAELHSLVQQVVYTHKPIRNHYMTFRDAKGHKRAGIIQAYFSSKKGSAKHPTVAFYIQETPLQDYTAIPEYKDESFHGMLGRSEAMQKVFRKIDLYAPTDAPVLITGETGTGKELVAHALHKLSRRGERRFLAVNCAALAEELLESELFGHERGSFTGAIRSHKGRFERAHQGTLFLDEIGEMPLRTQAKLLRVLEEGVFERVGGEHEVTVDVRIAAATNVPLQLAVQEGTFRADLYHRLAVLRVHLPALRERREDIPLLVTHFIHSLNQRYHREIYDLAPEPLALLTEYPWPGNIRELRNVLERVYIETPGDVMGLQNFEEWFYEHAPYFSDFPPTPHQRTSARYPSSHQAASLLPMRAPHAPPSGPPYPIAIEAEPSSFAYLPALSQPMNTDESAAVQPAVPRARQHMSRQCLTQAYLRAGGNIRQAAQLLGIHRATFYRWMHTLGITREELDALRSAPQQTYLLASTSQGLSTHFEEPQTE